MQTGHKNGFVRSRFLFLATLAAAFALFASARAQASAEQEVDKAVAASKAWVTQIDAGRYEDSYSFTCEETRNQFPQDRWVEVLKTFRGPWGSVVDRHQMSHVYKPNGVKGLEGECMVITYSTKFKNYDNVMETVTLKWEDGQWRGAGYFAGVPQDPNAPPVNPSYTTEIHTDPHVKPPAPVGVGSVAVTFPAIPR